MKTPRSVARTRVIDHRIGLRALGVLAMGLVLALGFSTLVRAEDKIITSHGISIFGDLKYPADFSHFDYVNPQAPKGGEMSTWSFGTFDSLSPYILKGNAATGSGVFFDTLLASTLDEPDASYGLLAHSIEYPENREWVIFHLRPEAQFSDGSPVTAEDVVFSFDILMSKGRPTFKIIYKDFTKVEALDPLRVKFTFDPEGPLRELIINAGGLPVFSKTYYETREFDESSLEPPLGSGAYLLKKVEAGRSVSYQRNPDYWAKDLPVNVGQNNFDVLTFEYFADYTTAFEAFKAGAYTYREEYLSKLWATGYEFPAIEEGWVKVESLRDGRPSGTQGFWFNMRRAKFQDARVRQAIAMGFNFEWSNQSLFHGLYTRTDSFWENSNMQAEGVPNEQELALLEPLRGLILDSVFDQPAFVPPVSNERAVGDRKALRAAGKLLDAAGWTVSDDGLRRDADGQVLSVEFLTDSPSFERIINPYIQNLTRLGVQATSERVDAAQSAEREENFEYDIVTQRYAMSQTPGTELRGIFGSETAEVLGSNNKAGLQDEAVDMLIRNVEEAKTRDELNTAVKALDRVLRSLHIWVPQWYKPVHNVAYFDMYERPYTDTPPEISLGEMSIWWFNPDKAAALNAAGALR